MVQDTTLLELRNIHKTFPGVIALNDVSFDIKKGEIHGLVGENGAGKSTLIKTCSGAIKPDSGKIVINGEMFPFMTPSLSEKKGIAVIYQEFNLVDGLTVAENVFLGRAIRKGPIVDTKAMVNKTREIFEQLGITIDPNETVGNLTIGYQQLVEIAKALSANAQLIIMDEPTAPLTNTETEHLFTIVDKLKSQGISIIYISHRLKEIFRLTDRITIMRDGTKITTMKTSETDTKQLIELMVGRELKEAFPFRPDCIQNDVALDVQNLCGNGVANISFQVHRGEILGFGGLIGAGRTEIAELLFGVKQKTKGRVKLKGMEITVSNPKQAILKGIAYVSEDRKRLGILGDISIRENITIAIVRDLSRMMVVNRGKEKSIVERLCDELRIKTPTVEQLAKHLSGGNQQKVVLAKWLSSAPELIIFDEPTRGIDVGAKYEIYKLINDLATQGKAVIMISSEMEELIGMSDRIVVLSEGSITGTLSRAEFSQENILEYASINMGEIE
jgi:ribose transport system ATP-binding protein